MPINIVPKKAFIVLKYYLLVGVIILPSAANAQTDMLSARETIHQAINYADSLMSIQELDSALVIGTKALDSAKKVFSGDDTTTARILHRLGVYYYLLAQYDNAEDCWRSALKIRRAILGERHPDVALLLNNLGNLYWNEGKYEESESTYTQAITTWDKAVSADNPDQALSIDGLATLYWSLGRYAEAESLFYRALDIREKAYGPFHEDVATTLNNLAILYDDEGKYNKTEEMYLRALDILEKTLGENHPNVAVTLNNLGNLYFFRGMYSKVERFHKRALQIRIKAFGENHPDVAYSLNNLAVLYWSQGRLEEAESLYYRAIKIWDGIDPEHLEAARSLSNLADILREKGEYQSAERLMERALTIRENKLGEDHPEVALSYDNLVSLNVDQRNYRQALAYHDRAIAIREKVFGNDNPAVAWNLAGKGKIYMLLGNYSKALPLFKKSLGIRKTVFSPEHPDIIDNQLDLARLFACTGEVDSSVFYFKKALDSRRYFMDNVFGYASEDQKLRYVNTYPLLDNSVLSAALKYKTPELINAAFKMVLTGKAAVVDAMAAEKKAATYTNNERLKMFLNRWSEIVEEIANLSITGMAFRDEETYHDQLKSLYSSKDSLETELSSAFIELGGSFGSRDFAITDIAQLLSPKSVLLEYVKYKPYNFDASGSEESDSSNYHYLVFAQKHEGRVSIFDLGDAAIIDSLIHAARTMIYEAGSDVYTIGDSTLVAKLNEVTTALKNRVFGPFENIIADQTQILISPDGQLNLIPFEILTDNTGNYLIDKYRISYLSSGRDLLKFKSRETFANNVVLVADPDFDKQSSPESTKVANDYVKDQSDYFSYHMERGEHGCLNTKFNRIPFTKIEAIQIADLFSGSGKTDILEFFGSEASEQNLKFLSSAPGILHIATHGFFCEKESEAIENPLLKSGLVLSGANSILENPDSNLRNEDGILTALEVSGMNLVNTELVTLSACETGVGDVVISEGVYGLRRAFEHAGAHSILMSLWKIPDKETAEMMNLFYRHYLAGESKQQALRESSLEMMKNREDKFRASHPYFWAAFILIGDPE